MNVCHYGTKIISKILSDLFVNIEISFEAVDAITLLPNHLKKKWVSNVQILPRYYSIIMNFYSIGINFFYLIMLSLRYGIIYSEFILMQKTFQADKSDFLLISISSIDFETTKALKKE